jgi:hypothetical protein
MSEKIKWEAEEYHCVNEFLNKLNVPKEDANGRTYSTVGRIQELMRMCESEKYPTRELSKNDWVENVLNK